MKRESKYKNLVLSGKKRLTSQYLLMRELIRDPHDIGALCPSSEALANEMASALSRKIMRSGLFVELGAGTGPVTEALLRRGMPPERLIAVEKSEVLAECLAKRFPEVCTLCCGAEELRTRLGADAKVRAVISSLPFRSLPGEVCRSVMSVIEDILEPGGLYIQFTYALLGRMPFVPPHFRKLRTKLVLCNIPPAKVEVFRKPKTNIRSSHAFQGLGRI